MKPDLFQNAAESPLAAALNRPNKRLPGNSVAEYALAGCLIVVVCLGMILTFSGNLNKAFASLKEDMRAQKETTRTELIEQKQQKAGVLATGLNEAQRNLLDDDLATKIQTTGANGATELLASQMELTAQKMLAEGKINQQQYDGIMRLANQGHLMARMQGMVEDAVLMAGGDYNKFSNTSFTVDGTAYTAAELARNLGFYGVYPEELATIDILNFPDTWSPTSDGFLDIYADLKASGALNDPTIKATIDSAAVQILQMGEATESQMTYYFRGDIAPKSLDEVRDFQAEKTTHMGSAQICTAGDFKDSGVLCSK